MDLYFALSASTNSEVQPNISLLIKENNQLQNKYTDLLTDRKNLQQKLDAAEGKLSTCSKSQRHTLSGCPNGKKNNNDRLQEKSLTL